MNTAATSPVTAAVSPKKSRRFLTWTLAIFLIALGGEIAARLDDAVFSEVPFFANPHREIDLVVYDEFGVHGRPNGRFKKWKLNAFGFRSPPLDLVKPLETTRIAILGASETFGLYEPEGKEYAAQLREKLRANGRDNVEIVNAAMAGISVKSMTPYWNRWVAKTRPDFVVIYPSPLFYLDDELPRGSTETPDSEPTETRIRSRFLERLTDNVRQSDLVRQLRVRFVLATKLPGKDEGYVFDRAPCDRLAAYLVDLEELLDSISRSGATPILLTHASKCANPPEPRDQAELEAMRLFLLRAQPRVMAEFEANANEAMRELANRRNLALIDVDHHLTTKREYFADLVHFNEAGAGTMADFLVKELMPFLDRKGRR